MGKATIKFIPSNIQPSRTEYPPTSNNTTNQSDNNILPINIKKLEFYKIIGPLMIVVVIASTLLYINSYEKLNSNLNDLTLFQTKSKDQTKNKKR